MPGVIPVRLEPLLPGTGAVVRKARRRTGNRLSMSDSFPGRQSSGNNGRCASETCADQPAFGHLDLELAGACMQLRAVDADVGRSGDADADLVAVDLGDGDLDAAVDDDLFADLAG